MSFTKRILLEHLVKYAVIFTLVIAVAPGIKESLVSVSSSRPLDSVALLMSIIALASISGYFAFSYTTVAKNYQRYFGYLATFFLGTSITFSLIIIYFIATIWIPELNLVWTIIFGSLFIGTVIFDNLDLLRMGLDVAATSFFEKNHRSVEGKSYVGNAIIMLREGQRLSSANVIIGTAIREVGKDHNDITLLNGGQWIIDHAEKEQSVIDQKVSELLKPYSSKSKVIETSIALLEEGQKQRVADRLIADILSELQIK